MVGLPKKNRPPRCPTCGQTAKLQEGKWYCVGQIFYCPDTYTEVQEADHFQGPPMHCETFQTDIDGEGTYERFKSCIFASRKGELVWNAERFRWERASRKPQP